MSMASMGPPATPSRHRPSASVHSFPGNEYEFRSARGAPGRPTHTPTAGVARAPTTPSRGGGTPHRQGQSTPSGQRTHPGVLASSSVPSASMAAAPPVHDYTPDVYAEPATYGSAPTTPARSHRVSRSVGCLPVSPAVAARKQSFESPSNVKVHEPSLPPNPSVWTPSELAQYLSWALRVGGADGRGPTLPAPVVEDVVSWVLRSRVDGRQFIKGIEHGVTRPPPFLPVLETASRRLRRRNGRRMSDAMSEAEVTDEDGGVEGVTRVRRLAHAYDIISSASEASGDDESLSALRAQLTGDSVHGFGRATPKTEPRTWARRDSTTSTASLASGVSGASAARWSQRVASDASSVGLWPDDSSFNSPTAPLRAKMDTKAANELAELAALANSAQEHAAKKSTDATGNATEASPPPPYDSASTLPSPARPGLLFPPGDTTPETDADRSGTATPHRSGVDLPDLTQMSGRRASGVDPYAVLRRDAKAKRPGKSPAGGISGVPGCADSDESDKENRGTHWSTTRRVTARPRDVRDALALLPASPATAPRTPNSTASAASTPGSGSRPRRRPRDMHREVAALTTRIRELEERLAAVETPPASASASAFNASTTSTTSTTSAASGASGALGALGAGGASGVSGVSDASGTSPPTDCTTPPQADPAFGPHAPSPSPDTTRARDTPVMPFLIGIGVGVGFSAVFVRLLMHRKLLGA